MRFFVVILCCMSMILAQEEAFTIQDQTSSTLSPAEVKSDYYASLRVAPILSQFYSANRQRNTSLSFNFGVDTGWIYGEKKDILFGLFLDGSTAVRDKRALYSLGMGVSLGGRLWDGRVIPQVRLGYLLAHLPINVSKQYNVQGGLAEFNMFFDIAKGYGMFVAYRHGFAMEVLKASAPRFNVSAVMIGFNFYDFDLSW